MLSLVVAPESGPTVAALRVDNGYSIAIYLFEKNNKKKKSRLHNGYLGRKPR